MLRLDICALRSRLVVKRRNPSGIRKDDLENIRPAFFLRLICLGPHAQRLLLLVGDNIVVVDSTVALLAWLIKALVMLELLVGLECFGTSEACVLETMAAVNVFPGMLVSTTIGLR